MTETRSIHRLAALVAAAALAACGGGGGDSSSTSTGPDPVASPYTGAPTAVIGGDLAAAQAAVAAVRAGANAVIQVFTFGELPLGVVVSPALGVVSPPQDTSCATIDPETRQPRGGGKFVTEIDSGSDNALSPGDTWRTTYVACDSGQGTVRNGKFTRTYTAYTSTTSYAYNIATTDAAGTINGTAFGPYTFQAHLSREGGNTSIFYMVAPNSDTVIGQPVGNRVADTITLVNAKVRRTSTQGTGFVEVTFTNWAFNANGGNPSGGSVEVTGANGTRATVTPGERAYQVLIGGITFSVDY